MCDAYILTKSLLVDTDFASNLAQAAFWKEERMFRPEGLAPVLMPDGEVSYLTWGLRRPFVPPMYLVKSAAMTETPWKISAERGRCVIPMTSFFEVAGKDGCGRVYEWGAEVRTLMWVAGIWDVRQKKPRRFALITLDDAGAGDASPRPAVLSEPEACAYLRGDLAPASTGRLPLTRVELPGALRLR